MDGALKTSYIVKKIQAICVFTHPQHAYYYYCSRYSGKSDSLHICIYIRCKQRYLQSNVYGGSYTVFQHLSLIRRAFQLPWSFDSPWNKPEIDISCSSFPPLYDFSVIAAHLNPEKARLLYTQSANVSIWSHTKTKRKVFNLSHTIDLDAVPASGLHVPLGNRRHSEPPYASTSLVHIVYYTPQTVVSPYMPHTCVHQ